MPKQRMTQAPQKVVARARQHHATASPRVLPAGPHGPTPYVSCELDAVLHTIVSGEAKSLTAAALLHGYSRVSLMQNLRKPHVLARIAEIEREQATLDRVAARNHIRSLSTRARSEYVQLEASRTMLQDADKVGGSGPIGGVTISINVPSVALPSPPVMGGTRRMDARASAPSGREMTDITPHPLSLPVDDARDPGGQKHPPSPPTSPRHGSE